MFSGEGGGHGYVFGAFQNSGRGWWNEGDVAQTLRTPCGGDSTKANIAVYDARGNGDGQTCATITGDHESRVTDYTNIAVMAHGQANAEVSDGIVPTLNCNHEAPILARRTTSHRKWIVRRLTPLECCRLQGFPDWWETGIAIDDPSEQDVRWWSEVFDAHRRIMGTSAKPATPKQIAKWLKNPGTDSARYKMWGNGMALPCMLYVMQGIKEAAIT